MKLIIIGISGVTCSGKTTVAEKVHKTLNGSILINQDKYFLPLDDPRHVLIPKLNHFNWEILSSLDMRKMYRDVMQIIESSSSPSNIQENRLRDKIKFIVLEGFLLFNYIPIADVCSHKYFIDLSREVCWERRSKRAYDPPDVPGYFDKVVWPEYLKHKSEILSNESIHESVKFLDGLKNIDDIYDEIMKDIQAYEH